MTVSTAAGKVLTGSGPQRIFGSFLTAQKETRPAGRNPINKKSGSDLSSHSHKSLTYGRGRETKFPAKFFAKLSYKKAEGSLHSSSSA